MLGRLRILGLIGGAVAGIIAVSSGLAAPDAPDPIIQAMHSELSRSSARLHLDNFEAPYFISYRLTDLKTVALHATYGALTSSGGERYRALAVDVRVGSYKVDNTTDDESVFYNPRNDDSYQYERRYAAIENDTAALRQDLWLLTDYRYKQALEQFVAKRGGQIQKVEKPDNPDDFSPAPAVNVIEPIDTLAIDRKRWENIVRAISARFRKDSLIYDSDVDYVAVAQTRYLLTSEKTQLRTSMHNYSLSISAEARADDGMPLTLETVYKSHHLATMPDSSSLAHAADSLIDLLLALRLAPVMEPYTGPAIIRHGASGVFFHEALGHRLEGHRTRREAEGHTFKDKINTRIIPDFLTVVDDPTLTTAAGTELYGQYNYDEEGVKSSRTLLVDKGILRSFLMCRTPIKGINVSNGHGRADIWSDPVSRMGSLFVSADQPVSYNDLKAKLLDACRKGGKEYGLVFEDIASGETNTSSYGVQTLRVRPRVVKKVYVSDGHEELVRGVELIGTPLAVLESIQAASDDPGVFNGVCGAESGWVPVSAIAPSVLIGEIEVQKSDRNLKRGPILPPPLHDPGK
ncbi:MAG: TldD/PmbA family protein [candidate division Zixibacteria bacterium]|nr:TldD/PmbA family protein [candidate division Zixibacteria bacterium]